MRPILLLTAAGVLTGCFLVRRVQVDEVRAPVRDSLPVSTAVKAHMVDGSTVLYPNGVVVQHDRLVGPGQRYGLTLQFVEVVQSVPVDSVVGMETYRPVRDAIGTVGLSFVATTIGALAVTAAAAAIFGSCPTFYSDSADTPVLEAEGFSYSIAPLFEARDVDRLRARAGPDRTLRLEVRNEALETHYLNRLELIEVVHRKDEFVVPTPDGLPLALSGLTPPATAVDASGRDVAPSLADPDGAAFASDTARLATATVEEHEDHIDLVFPPGRGDSAAVVFRLRNSLLNTVLLYDVMLGSRGARALDWQASDLSRLEPALALGTWYSARMGLRILVPDGTGFREVGRIRDTGPIAWKDVAIVIPRPGSDSVRIRLQFPLDNWRIDRVALTSVVRHPASRSLGITRVEGEKAQVDTSALDALRQADRRYLETRPGQHFTAVWEVGAAPSGSERTWFLASQGYYTEWIRGSWIAGGRDTTPFSPTDGSLVQAMHQWRLIQDSMETRFYASRIPVR